MMSRSGSHLRAGIAQLLLTLCVMAACTATVQAQSVSSSPSDNNEDVFFRNNPDADKYVLIITGAAASDEIQTRFRQWSLALHDTLAGEYGYSGDSITLLLDDGDGGDNAGQRVDGSSRREDIESTLSTLQQQMGPGDQLTVFLIGHGSSLDQDAKFNIVGPDITGTEFALLLNGFNQQDVVVINTTSASYEFSAALSARGRVIISATRSAAERYDPVFAGYLLEALGERKGDRDKNQRVSVLEAYLYASQSAVAWYREQGRLPTERAVLDDNGDAVFSLEPGAGSGDGGLSEIAYIDVPGGVTGKTSPEARQLLADMQDLERSVFLLRGQKADYLEDEYWNRMETLLIELARKTGRYNELP